MTGEPVDTLSARDFTVVENGVVQGIKLEFAFDTLSWRAGTQKIFIVITADCSHTATSTSNITAPWRPGVPAEVLARLRGNATVHVVGPDRSCNANTLNYKPFTGTLNVAGDDAISIWLERTTAEEQQTQIEKIRKVEVEDEQSTP